MEAADDAGCALLAVRAERDALPVFIASVRREGWTPAEDALASEAFIAPDPDELRRAKRAAERVSDPWNAWGDLGAEQAAARDVLRRLLREHAPPTAVRLPDAGGESIDFDAEPEPPRWLVPDFIERGRVHMLSGGVGSFKSHLRESMMAASVTGTPFLGRQVEPLRWLVIDGENSASDVKRNLRAFGVRNEHREYLHLTGRDKGVKLGDPEYSAWLRDEADAFAPDVIVLDTVTRVCAGMDSMNADSVAALFGGVLVPLVDQHDCALLYVHHHRKGGAKKGTDEAVLGSVQWSGQAEQTLTIAPTSKLTQDGNQTRRDFVIHRPKGRTLVDETPEHIEAHGVLSDERALKTLSVRLKGDKPSETAQLVAALTTPLRSGLLAERLGMKNTDSKFRRLRADALADGLIVKLDSGEYDRA